MTFRPGYALAALVLFLIEVAIALWVRDQWLRPIGGDVLAVMLVYCGLRAVTRLSVVPAAILAVAVGFAVEAGQALNMVDRLGLGGNPVARTVLGTSFAWEDLAAYVSGGMIVLLIERLRSGDLHSQNRSFRA